MTKEFKMTGTCFPNEHYMVDISERVAQIKRMVDKNPVKQIVSETNKTYPLNHHTSFFQKI